MNILIIDNDDTEVQNLRFMLSEAEPNAHILTILQSVESAVNWLTQNPQPDLIFVDIQLNDGICFEIFEKVLISCPIIFITALEEYTLKILNANKLTFLVKPIDQKLFQNVLSKIFYKKHEIDSRKLLNQLLPRSKERFLIKEGEHYNSILSQNIACFYNKEHASFINTIKGKSYDIDFSLDNVEQMVCPNTFFRVNKSFIINYLAINDIVSFPSERLKIILGGWPSDQEEIIVSLERVTEFRNWLDR